MMNAVWYECIRPEAAPPGYVFPIVWTILYALLAVSFVRHPKAWPRYSLNIALNYAWYDAFFVRQDPRRAMTILVALWVSIADLARQDKLLWPYLAWVTFAGFLNLQAVRKQDQCALNTVGK
jgi:tryptophan-rich sensory protein